MGLFQRRKSGPQPADRIEWVTATARRMLAERGVEATIAHDAQPEDVALVAESGMRYPLFNAIAKTQGMTADEASRVIGEHLDSLLDAESATPLEQLTAEQLRQQIRTRLLPGGQGRADEPTFAYARAFSDGIILVLCVDFPRSVLFVSDANLHELALSLDELYAFGQLNTDREPIDERFEPAPGIEGVFGDSLFTASKAANLPAVIGSSPFGTLFTVPHRHMLIMLPIRGPETVAAVGQLMAITMQVLRGGPPPGGVLSPDIHFSRDHQVSRVSSIDETGAVSINVDERLQQALEDAIG